MSLAPRKGGGCLKSTNIWPNRAEPRFFKGLCISNNFKVMALEFNSLTSIVLFFKSTHLP